MIEYQPWAVCPVKKNTVTKIIEESKTKELIKDERVMHIEEVIVLWVKGDTVIVGEGARDFKELLMYMETVSPDEVHSHQQGAIVL